jgi:hypothetical protein
MFEAASIRDWIGMGVVDPDGDTIGPLESIYFDTATDAPSFAAVRTGIIGRYKLSFVPLDGATVTPKHLNVVHGKRLVKDAPSIPTDGELEAADEPAIFAHYDLPYSVGANGERRLGRR